MSCPSQARRYSVRGTPQAWQPDNVQDRATTSASGGNRHQVTRWACRAAPSATGSWSSSGCAAGTTQNRRKLVWSGFWFCNHCESINTTAGGFGNMMYESENHSPEWPDRPDDYVIPEDWITYGRPGQITSGRPGISSTNGPSQRAHGLTNWGPFVRPLPLKNGLRRPPNGRRPRGPVR